MHNRSADDMTLPANILSQGNSKNYNKDSIIHHQGDTYQHVCYVQSGRAFATAIDVDGNESFVTEYITGQFMGCEGLFENRSSQYQIIAKTPMTGILFSRDGFLALMNTHPGLNNLVVGDLSRQLQNYSRQTLEAHSLSVQGRIAAELRRQAKPIGKSPDTYIIRPTPVFSELAQRLGSSRETVSRTVSKMIKKDVIERKTGALIVHDIEALEREIK